MRASLLPLALIGLARSQTVELIDPISRYSDMELILPPADFPVLMSDFSTPPDCGETTYRGFGRLQGLRVLVTGGDSGIGRAAVIAYAREGAHVAINYLPEEESDAQDVADILAAEGIDIVRIPGDLTDETFCGDLVERAAEQMGGLDVLVGNAGYSAMRNNKQPITNVSTPEMERVFTVNVFANVWLAKAAVPLLPRGGSIVFTISGQAANPEPLTVDYGASKAAMAHLTRSLAQQLAPMGIRVNGVAPGFTFTPFLSTMGVTTEHLPVYTESSAYGRMQQPAEVASLFVNIVDPQQTFVSGEIVSSAGGRPGP